MPAISKLKDYGLYSTSRPITMFYKAQISDPQLIKGQDNDE